MERRDFLRAAGAVPLAAVLANPTLAAAAAERLETVSLTLGDGGKVKGYLAKPGAAPAPAVMLIHEWWGVNDQIKAVTAEFAKLGYLALAVDLMGGKVASTPEEAQQLTKGVDAARATETLVKWADWLRGRSDATGKLGTVGWCFGGGWSLSASIATPVDATVIYYGRVTQPAAELAKLRGPVLGHFANQDRFINKEMVSGFESEMAKAGKADRLTVYWYEADHAFANPTGARYDQEDAALSWKRTTAFLESNLKG